MKRFNRLLQHLKYMPTIERSKRKSTLSFKYLKAIDLSTDLFPHNSHSPNLHSYKLATHTNGVTTDICLTLGMPTTFHSPSLWSDKGAGSDPPTIDILNSAISLLSALLFFCFFAFTKHITLAGRTSVWWAAGG